MILLDRFIIYRFLSNFLVLFGLLFIFGISIDVIVQFDEFADAASRVAEANGRPYWQVLIHAILEFHGPRIFQFYAYMVGLVGVAAAGFTLAQMHRNRELVSIMASGTSLHRVAAAILAAQVGLVMVQLVDQELVLPRLAPMLVRDHQQILGRSLQTFEVPLTRDVNGNLLHASSLDPVSRKATELLVLIREEGGPALQRISASEASWDEASSSWILSDGESVGTTDGEIGGNAITKRMPIASFETDLSPQRLLVRRSLQFAQLLSVAQLKDLASGGGQDGGRLDRVIYSRFSGAIVNLLVMAMVIPFFLMRGPGTMLNQSIKAAAVSIPALLLGFTTMTLELPGFSPGVGAFLPVAIFLPIAIGRMAYLRT